MTGEYFDLQEVKNFLEITDDLSNTKLNQLGKEANQEIDLQMSRFADVLPLTGVYAMQAKRAAFNYVISKWKKKVNNLDAYKEFMSEFEKNMKTLKEALEAIPEGRTDTVVVANDYRSEPLRSRERFFD